ncbi:hypothetical protein J6590_034075 [Homalodisca vitripennis]|nr:hypothetical protein J6590_034075 [Homalodisca vitripennis]
MESNINTADPSGMVAALCSARPESAWLLYCNGGQVCGWPLICAMGPEANPRAVKAIDIKHGQDRSIGHAAPEEFHKAQS